ncbi:hypothetical protein [uncultured Alistipes sp.]|uniref:hypothetical protein n=1 Tax=uncultured Alistipes sp. TaxID=538949 RepID=UPI00260223B3|nr:hypothetical protein [uncultured Alistipes sp.]
MNLLRRFIAQSYALINDLQKKLLPSAAAFPLRSPQPGRDRTACRAGSAERGCSGRFGALSAGGCGKPEKDLEIWNLLRIFACTKQQGSDLRGSGFFIFYVFLWQKRLFI